MSCDNAASDWNLEQHWYSFAFDRHRHCPGPIVDSYHCRWPKVPDNWIVAGNSVGQPESIDSSVVADELKEYLL